MSALFGDNRNSLRYQVSKTGNLLFESPEKEGVHDDYLWALALVFIEVLPT